MRLKIVFIALLSALIFSSCKKEQDVKKFIYDPDAKAHIKEATGLRSEETAQTMTWAEIVRAPRVAITQTYSDGTKPAQGLQFTPDLRDLEKNELLLPGFMIIGMRSDNKLYINEKWLNCTDLCIYIEDEDFKNRDTVAYIPNADRAALKSEIERLFKEGSSDAIYTLFRDAYKAKRCTGAEWRALKAQGLN